MFQSQASRFIIMFQCFFNHLGRFWCGSSSQSRSKSWAFLLVPGSFNLLISSTTVGWSLEKSKSVLSWCTGPWQYINIKWNHNTISISLLIVPPVIAQKLQRKVRDRRWLPKRLNVSVGRSCSSVQFVIGVDEILDDTPWWHQVQPTLSPEPNLEQLALNRKIIEKWTPNTNKGLVHQQDVNSSTVYRITQLERVNNQAAKHVVIAQLLQVLLHSLPNTKYSQYIFENAYQRLHTIYCLHRFPEYFCFWFLEELAIGMK